MDFSKFDKMVDAETLAGIKEAEQNQNTYKEVKKGTYLCDIDKLEIRETKDGRPMLSSQFRIVGDEDGNKCEFTKSCIFMNRVLYGTKNDANMIASAVGWLKTLEFSEDVPPIEFENYSQFAELVADCEEDVVGLMQYEVSYDPDAFNSISIDGAFEKEDTIG